MLPVVWHPQASDDLDHIAAFVAEWDPAAAVELINLIEDAATLLAQFPYMGRLGRVLGTRELLPHTNYCLIYEVTSANVEIVAVVHSRREYP
jgi:plasmid stabilization system protein ParE